jgi:hypothetical protein
VCHKDNRTWNKSQVHKHTQYYSVQYYEHFKRQYNRLSLHTQNSSTESKDSVFYYIRKAALNFALSFWRIVRPCGKLLKMLMAA